jgi:cysteinyl-tRNA synthetase
MQDMLGINVDFAMGITDIDNKIVDRAAMKGIAAKELASRYESEFLNDMEALNVRAPNVLLRVTEHIPEILAYISRIIENGNAYVKPHGVYFAVHKVSGSYGKLGRVTEAESEDVIAGASDDNDKIDKRDFALWKVTSSEPCWDSPWGRGRPGWHIECSAMTHAYFGSEVDLHSGGIDLEFPHHTNEIAQW